MGNSSYARGHYDGERKGRLWGGIETALKMGGETVIRKQQSETLKNNTETAKNIAGTIGAVAGAVTALFGMFNALSNSNKK